MKKAVIVVGKPNAGKSTTIREFIELVKKHGEMYGLHMFTLNGKRGFLYLTSFEEYGRDVEATIDELSGLGFDFLVFACQGPLLADVHRALKRVSFAIADVNLQTPTEAPKKAMEILKFLNQM